MTIPEFKNSDHAKDFGALAKGCKRTIYILKIKLKKMQVAYNVFMKHGQEKEAFNLATGQKQFVNEALTVAQTEG